MRRGPGYIRYLGHIWAIQRAPEESRSNVSGTRGMWFCISCDARIRDQDVWCTIRIGGSVRHKLFCCTDCIPNEPEAT